jgi:two-component system sensor histidine kinase KdpD
MLSEIARRTAAAIDNARLLGETRRVADELRAANAAKDEFLGLVSHELRTPLTAVRGNAEVLLQRMEQLNESGREGALRDIANESERLNRIIDNLLLLARVEQGQEAEREPLVVVRIVERVLARHRRRNPSRGFEIVEHDRPRPVSFVEGYLEQVVENLVSNAEKYSPSHEPIRIEIERDDMEVRIRVLDRGVGITQEEADQLFEPFYRARATSGRAAGLGIGLSVCKRLVTAQGGRVWAQPREGGGAEFGFALPILDEGAAA